MDFARERSELKRAVKDLTTNELRVAELLFWACIPHDDGVEAPYRAWGYFSFREFADQELNLHYKKAEKMRRIGEFIAQYADLIPNKNLLKKLGVSKLYLLTRFVDRQSVSEWLEKALTLSCSDLDRIANDKILQLEDPDRQVVPAANLACVATTFYTTASEKEDLDRVLNWAQQNVPRYRGGRGAVLMALVRELVLPLVEARQTRTKKIRSKVA